jgi:RNA polymerase sigma-70 factor (ECF subfamily)
VPTNAEKWVDEHGDYLFRFALSRLRQREAAEDLVQETFLAALQARKRFAGASSVLTWLVGILKRKIVDHLRRKGREQPASDLAATSQCMESLFDERGNWKKKPGKWPADPSATLEKAEFHMILSRCLGKLPERLADAFTLREVEELDSQEVCKVLDISANNLWVMLHRARVWLRRCLEVNWFGIKNRGRHALLQRSLPPGLRVAGPPAAVPPALLHASAFADVFAVLPFPPPDAVPAGRSPVLRRGY